MFLLPINDVRSGVLANSQLAILNEAVKKTNTPSLKISIIGQDVSIQSLYTIAESIKNNNKNIIISPAGSTKHSRNIMLSKLKPGVPIQCYYHDPLEEDSIPNYVNVNIIPKFRHFKNEMEWIQTL